MVDLSALRTHMANERTYLAIIRTSAIFAGISLLLINQGFPKIGVLILIFAIILTISNTVIYILQYNRLDVKTKESKASVYLNLAYSICIIVIFAALIYMVYYHKKK